MASGSGALGARADREQHAAGLDPIDDHRRHARIERRAAPAAAQAAAAAQAKRRAHVLRGMDHDPALLGEIVHAGVEAEQAQRGSMLAGVDLLIADALWP